jgi:hypothetical protein
MVKRTDPGSGFERGDDRTSQPAERLVRVYRAHRAPCPSRALAERPARGRGLLCRAEPPAPWRAEPPAPTRQLPGQRPARPSPLRSHSRATGARRPRRTRHDRQDRRLRPPGDEGAVRDVRRERRRPRDPAGRDDGRTRAALKRLEAHGLAASQDVNDAAQGDRRSGSYKSLAWVSQPSHDDATWDEADAAFSVAYGLATEADEPTLPPVPRGKKSDDDGAGVDPDVAVASIVLNDPTGKTKPGTKPKARKTREPAAVKPKPSRRRVLPEGVNRSQARKLVHEPSGLIMRMSPASQARCIEDFGSLPTLGGVAFVPALNRDQVAA